MVIDRAEAQGEERAIHAGSAESNTHIIAHLVPNTKFGVDN